jgi:hypothetical protein
METVNNVVNAASKAIWGEQNPQTATGNETAGQEPVSGMQGKGSADSPFDQGNASEPTTTAGKTDLTDHTTTSSTGPTTDLTDRTTTSSTGPTTDLTDRTASSSAGPTPDLKPYSSSSEPTTSAMSESTSTKPSGPTDAEIPHNPNNAAAGGGPNPLKNTEGTGVTGSSAQNYTLSGGDLVPSNASSNPGVAPSSGAAPGGQKQQGADRPLDAPSSSAKEDDTEAILKKRDPNDHSGEPMHMHTGKEKDTFEERRESKAGNPGGIEHGKEQGTGEEWVKTSGLHADGGDFDATKPGAGREADRILEEKGIHRDAKGSMDKPDAATTSTGLEHTGKEGKVSKMDKIKDKLHIGSKDK